MNKENFDKAVDVLASIERCEEALHHLNHPDGLYHIRVCANNKQYADGCDIVDAQFIKDIQPFLAGYFESRKEQLQKEFQEL